MYGQWQIDVKLGNNYGSSDVFCEAFVLSGRDEYGNYVDGLNSLFQAHPTAEGSRRRAAHAKRRARQTPRTPNAAHAKRRARRRVGWLK